MKNPNTVKEKKVKAWAVINEKGHGLNEGILFEPRGASRESIPFAVFKTEEEARASVRGGGVHYEFVPCTITYTLPN